jgi:hypothetical protein
MIATKKMNVSPVPHAAGDQAPMNSTSRPPLTAAIAPPVT